MCAAKTKATPQNGLSFETYIVWRGRREEQAYYRLDWTKINFNAQYNIHRVSMSINNISLGEFVSEMRKSGLT